MIIVPLTCFVVSFSFLGISKSLKSSLIVSRFLFYTNTPFNKIICFHKKMRKMKRKGTSPNSLTKQKTKKSVFDTKTPPALNLEIKLILFTYTTLTLMAGIHLKRYF